MEMTICASTCPDSTCAYRGPFGYCSHTTCVYNASNTTVKASEPKTECALCENDLVDGNYLFQMTSRDNAISFLEIVAHYCPVCGRNLKRR